MEENIDNSNTDTIEAIRKGRIKAEDFIDAVLPFSQAVEGYEGLKKRTSLSVVFKWN